MYKWSRPGNLLAVSLGDKLKVVYVSRSVAANGAIEIPSARAGVGAVTSENSIFDTFSILPDSAASLRIDQGGWKATFNNSSTSDTICVYKNGSKLCIKNTHSEAKTVTVVGFFIF